MDLLVFIKKTPIFVTNLIHKVKIKSNKIMEWLYKFIDSPPNKKYKIIMSLLNSIITVLFSVFLWVDLSGENINFPDNFTLSIVVNYFTSYQVIIPIVLMVFSCAVLFVLMPFLVLNSISRVVLFFNKDKEYLWNYLLNLQSMQKLSIQEITTLTKVADKQTNIFIISLFILIIFTLKFSHINHVMYCAVLLALIIIVAWLYLNINGLKMIMILKKKLNR